MTQSVLKAWWMNVQTENNRAPSPFAGGGWRGNIVTWTSIGRYQWQARSQADAMKPGLRCHMCLDANNPYFVACEQQRC